MDRDDINKHKERLLECDTFREFVDALALPHSYKSCSWLERDYETLHNHGEVYAQSLMLPYARSFKDFFRDSTGGYDTDRPERMYYLCGNTPNRPDRMFNEKGKFYKEYVYPSDKTIEMIETLFGDIHRTRSFEMIKWKNGKTLVLVHHGEVVPATGWLGVI